MATEAIGGETPTLFLRKATGLVRGWSVRDSIIYACLATNFVTLGFYAALVGFAVVVGLLLFNSHASFVSSFNLEAHKLFGVSNAYNATNHAAVKAGYTVSSFGFGPLGQSMLLVPAMMFFILWPNWGATLYGEIRGASDFRRVFTGMFAGLWMTVILTLIFVLLIV